MKPCTSGRDKHKLVVIGERAGEHKEVRRFAVKRQSKKKVECQCCKKMHPTTAIYQIYIEETRSRFVTMACTFCGQSEQIESYKADGTTVHTRGYGESERPQGVELETESYLKAHGW